MLGFLGVILFLVAALIVYSSFLRPEYEKVNKLRGTLWTQSRFFDEQSKIIENIESYLGTAEVNIKKAQEPVSLVLPAEVSAASLFQQFSFLTRINGLVMQSFGLNLLSIQPVAPGALLKGIGTVQANIKFTGGYQSFKDFLAQLETNDRLMNLMKLTIKTTASKNLYDYNITVDTYYQPD